jgi:PAS domain S-box-containing protein
MKWPVLFYLLPYFISLATSAAVGIYCWIRRSEVPAADAYGFVAFSQALWTLGFIFELVTPSLGRKLFWDDFQYIGAAGFLVGFLAFTLVYTRREPKRIGWICLLASIPLVVMVASVFMEAPANVRVVDIGPLQSLLYDFRPITDLMSVYGYAVYVVCLGMLISCYMRSHPLYRKQIGLIIAGSAAPVLGTALMQTLLKDHPARDISPLTFAINNIVVAWGLFRYGMFDIVPVARHAVIDSMTDAVFVLDGSNRLVDFNQAAQKILGLPASEIIGRPAGTIFWPALRDPYNDERTEIEVEIGGEQRSIEVTVQPLNDAQGRHRGRVLTMRDVTQRKRMDGELRRHRDHLEDLVTERTAELTAANEQLRERIAERERLEDQLRQAQKMEAIGRLAGGIAHDFNNLLTAILGYSHLLLSDPGAGEPIREAAEAIRRSGERAASLTAQLLAFSRKQRLDPRVLDLNLIVSEIERMLLRVVGEQIEVITVLQPRLAHVEADPNQIEHILMNLVVNSRDAMPEGGKLIVETRDVILDEVTLEEEQPGLRPAAVPRLFVVLSVKDTGVGMDEATQKRIFEPFFTTKEMGKGTGLGLSMVYGTVKQSGGHISVESRPGRGTTFKIYLPATGKIAVSDQQGPELSELLRGTETILLVEDEDMVRALARQALERYGYRVLDASCGLAALAAAERYRGKIDLMITDVVMPDMNGIQLAEQVRAVFPETKVLYMSGYSEDITGSRDSGEMTNFVPKPFTPAFLARKVRQTLDSKTTPASSS